MARTVPIVEARDLSSFFTEDIGVERSANSGPSVDVGQKPMWCFLEKTALLVRRNGEFGRETVGTLRTHFRFQPKTDVIFFGTDSAPRAT